MDLQCPDRPSDLKALTTVAAVSVTSVGPDQLNYILAMTSTTQDEKMKLGEAGEHLVASRILACGLVAGQLPRGYKSDDLYVERGREVVHIQVKTRVGPLSWPTGVVSGKKNRYYALVHFDSLEIEALTRPVIYLVPSIVVAKAVTLHEKYYFDAHPNSKGPGVPAVADPFSMDKMMAKHRLGRGWLEKYREPWATFREQTLA